MQFRPSLLKLLWKYIKFVQLGTTEPKQIEPNQPKGHNAMLTFRCTRLYLTKLYQDLEKTKAERILTKKRSMLPIQRFVIRLRGEKDAEMESH